MCRHLALIASVILVGCAAPPPVGTPSGNLEVVLTNVRADCVRAELLNALVSSGATIRSTSDVQIVAGRPSDNALANALLSSRYGGTPEERVTMLLLPVPNFPDVRLAVSVAYVTNQGSAFEKVQPVRPSAAQQEQLVAARSRVENLCRK